MADDISLTQELPISIPLTCCRIQI